MPEGVAGREDEDVETAERRDGGRRLMAAAATVGDESGESSGSWVRRQ
jgi:hypothetical protein